MFKVMSATTSRSPWNEDSMKLCAHLFKEEISAQSVSMTCVRDKIESNPVLCLEDPKRVYDKVRAEWRYKGNTDSSMELTKLPEETETAKVLVELFPDMVNDGKPISKPVIIKRLSECSKGDLFKDYNVVASCEQNKI
ncbi:hypothetical protein OS493_032499 [Desmophyllum pertusum]|uniref:Uncharacterized protein n=1 Tax=Desmophyllum pertusum TaxID=174260 RepID=A0A9X0CV67_9CNID|nr:hypothetical protein OS493_032499 [Desmophyllum pertusum]